MGKMKVMFFVMVFLWSMGVYAQNSFYVLNTKGNVKIKKTGVILKPNMVLSDRDIITFSSTKGAVLVCNSKNVRMVLKPKTAELSYMVSEILNPGSGRVTTKLGPITNNADLKKYLSDDSLQVFTKINFWISPSAFQINQSQFFFIRYKWSGETINKKLFIEKDSLLLEADEIFKVDGRLILPGEIQGVSLHYKKGTTVTEIGPFTISFPDESVVKEMIMAFKKHTSSKGEDFIEEVVSLMYDMYGKTDKNNVRAWVKANIGVY